MRPGTHQRNDGQMQRGLAAGGGDGTYAAFKRCNALLEYRIGGVAES